MKQNYANNIPKGFREDKLTEREREIVSYTRAWFWGGTDDQTFLMKRLLERIHYLEDTVEELQHTLNKSK